MTQKDILFLLAPGFEDNGRREYCPECAEIWGLLSYFPAILLSIEISYQPIGKPRTDMVKLLGDENQNCPTLLLVRSHVEGEMIGVKIAGPHCFIDNARDIGRYFSHLYGTPLPRGD
ncbi:DUF3088 family protein [Parvularcula sp. IMCC14364]|uniref:DUF3088 family protein n=1 Tax=Parvularcula sp. IMCC14364 TaxID=3067902 RepID=UPI0027424DB8|nr:DUF3088 family protein [Parvularcula sp. IMCC14364]